jgi:hypothetical protein
MEFIEQLKSRFANLAKEYISLIDGVKQSPGKVVYCDQDIFTLEPFYAEINNLPQVEPRLVDDPEELDGPHIFQLVIHQGKALLHREWIGDDCYYDGIFLYADQQKSRLVVYVKDQIVKPIKLEILNRDQMGHYQSFYSISDYAIEEVIYQYSGMDTKVDRFCINNNIRQQINSYQVYRSPRDYSIRRIESLHEGKSQLIYDAEINQQSLEELLELALKHKANDIINACDQEAFEDKKIHCLLIEYSSQSPMCCSLALVQQDETIYKEDEHPLGWLNAPDIEYFLTDLETEHTALYNTIDQLFYDLQEKEFDEHYQFDLNNIYAQREDRDNKTIDPGSHHESQAHIKNFYIKLCKRLQLALRQHSLFEMADDFYVCARDYESIKAYESYQADQLTNNPKIRLINEMKERAATVLPELIATAEKTPKDYWYSNEQYYFIEPFGLEIKTGLHADYWQDLLSREIPESGFYFRYQIYKDFLISMAQISEGQVVRQWFWETTPDHIFEIEQYCFKGEPFVENCRLLDLEQNRASRYQGFGLAYEQNTYQWNSEGNIFQSSFSRSFPGAREVNAKFDIFYEYTDGKISKIHRQLTEWDDDERFCILFPKQNFDEN